MRLATYSQGGAAVWGIVTSDGVVDVGEEIRKRYPTLRDAIAANVLDEAARSAKGPATPLDQVTFLPVIPNPDKIICAGVNYEEHRIETNRERTDHPTIFLRLAGSQVGHGGAILLPPESVELDYEGEIAVIIGKAGRRISRADAWSHIAGYAPYNDASIRDWQRHTGQWASGKNFVATGAFGPWMVTRDEIGDGEEISVETRLNGKVMQHATTAMMIFDIPRLIEYASTFTQLLPGDVIATGTPGGVGVKRSPQVFMTHGDTVEIEVGKVGTLINRVERETVA
ncbi:MAG: fumarylacetoacetate hydrolase family protein [Mesorhizobium sp.]